MRPTIPPAQSDEPAPYGLYVHVPWCRVRCPYCAFAVVPHRGTPDWEPFVAAILRERELRPAFRGPPATLYLGGGTPSRLPVPAVEALIAGLAPRPGAEVTMEVNPEDLSTDWLAGVVAAGVNRISLGVQSFVPHVARWLGRGHTQRRADAALSLVRVAGLRSFSIDLIFAVPGQTRADLDVDLAQVLSHGVPHVSLYGLTFEPGTRHGERHARGRVEAVDDGHWRDLYDHLVARLHAHGLERYEVSNFARDGHRSMHNRTYWSDGPYLGLGPSAHGYLPDGTRYANLDDLADWQAAADPTAWVEPPDPRRRFADLVLSSLRAVEGLDCDHLREVTGLQPDPRAVRALVAGGLLAEQGSRLVLTADGFPLCDAVVSRLVTTCERGHRAGAG